MRYRSTRDGMTVTLDEALVRGIAADGGLFLPDRLPRFATGDFTPDLAAAGSDDAAGNGVVRRIAKRMLLPFFTESSLATELESIVAETFSFPLPVRTLPVAEGYCGLLELFHGPTAAFKDVGAAFLAACLSRLQADAAQPLTILVATSGDTGGAVAAAFNERPGMRVAVLFPDGRVSARQAQQLTCWGDNVLSLAVQGSFDDCQSMVKAAMADRDLSARHRFSSANSINIGRLLPQAIYYAHASLAHWQSTGRKPAFVVPTGNLGNALAAFMARECGLPIGEILLATNANRLVVDFLAGAEWTPRTSLQTLATAMDVGNPSNMERLRILGGEPAALRSKISAVSVTDEQISEQIRQNDEEFGVITCPHTATATWAWRHLDADARRAQDWILVATAHAAKFEQIVEPIIGRHVPLPDALAAILSRPSRVSSIAPDLQSLAAVLARNFSN